MPSVSDQEDYDYGTEDKFTLDCIKHSCVMEYYNYIYGSIALSKKTFFITFTLKPSAYSKTSPMQYLDSRGYVYQCIKKHTKLFGFVPEVTQNGQIHYHGWLKMRDANDLVLLIDTVKREARHILGFVKVTKQPIETKEQAQRVSLYMVKQATFMRKLLKIPYKYLKDGLYSKYEKPSEHKNNEDLEYGIENRLPFVITMDEPSSIDIILKKN